MKPQLWSVSILLSLSVRALADSEPSVRLTGIVALVEADDSPGEPIARSVLQPAVRPVESSEVASSPVSLPPVDAKYALVARGADGQDIEPELDATGESGFWFRGAGGWGWTKGNRLPALATTSPTGTPLDATGVLGVPGTRIQFGDSREDGGLREAVGIEGGWWADDFETFGIEGGWFGFGESSTGFVRGSGGDPLLARPFFNASTGLQDSQLVAFPGVLSGSVSVDTTTDFQGAELLARSQWLSGEGVRVDWLAGYRYLSLDDHLGIRESLVSLAPLSAGTTIGVRDQFRTQNQFHGLTIGFASEIRRSRWSLDLVGKLGLGGNQEGVDIDGRTSITTPGGGTVVAPGGLLAQRTNIGSYRQTEFVIVPELDISVGYQLTRHMRGFVGYQLIYWSDVVRSGDQIDAAVNSTQIPPGILVGPPRPRFQFEETDFWAQSLNVGLEFRF
jgi:hypothetical protein